MKPVLITGSRGFVAGALYTELRRRHPDWRLIRLDHKPKPGHQICELLDAPAVKRLMAKLRPELVFHLAGTTKPVGADGLWRAHVEATLSLLRALEGTGARVWISGSAAEYGETGPRPARESARAWPETLYGSSKLAQTLAALSFNHQGLSVSVARIFNILGPGTPESLALGSFARQITAIEKGARPASISVGNLSPQRDFIDVRDAARALVALADRGRPGQIYNVCSGQAHTMAELLRKMLLLSSEKIEIVQEPGRLRAADVRHCCGDPGKARREAGWRAQVPLEQSLKDTLESARRA